MEKYIKMLVLSAQIEVLKDLPYQTVYKSDAQLNDLKQKSAVMMDDLIRILNEKRAELQVLDGTVSINKLKGINKEQDEQIDALLNHITND